MSRTAERPYINPFVMVFLIGWVNSRKLPVYLVERAKIVLLSREGMSDTDIGKALRMDPDTVGKWRKRFIEQGVEGLLDKLRSGKPRSYDYKKVALDVLNTLGSKPPDGTSLWTAKMVAEEIAVSEDIVGRILRKAGIRLGALRTWCVSKDPRFYEKAAEVIWWYMNAPENCTVIALDEKTSIQALQRATGFVRTRNGGFVRAMNSTYKRNGVVNLFAGLDIKKGIVYTQKYERKRRIEFLQFMEQLVDEVPGIRDMTRELHIVMDNYCIHKGCDEWLKDHPNVHFHYTPTSASWLNLCEVFFGKLSRTVLKGGNFQSTDELALALDAFIRNHNAKPKAYVWRAREVTGTQLRNKLANFCD
ncbi:MAG: IS630 family transposase [Deltaproteobacteria bacterium]|jgi:transposase|nr:IS630 family transposase [Deltaproteobacteria bacterium]